MSKQWRYKDLEELGRVRLSENFYMREFLHSEISQVYGLLNAPDNPELAIESGRQLCELVLEPIQEAWGKVHIRSGYRSEAVNKIGNEKKHNCSNNEKNYAAHIWDVRDNAGTQVLQLVSLFLSMKTITKRQGTGSAWLGGCMRMYLIIQICVFSKINVH